MLRFDAAPYPGEWALSRLVDEDVIVDVQRPWTLEEHSQNQIIERRRHQPLIETLEANFLFCCRDEGFLDVPRIYNELFHRTKNFATSVQDLVIATGRHAPSRWADAARLIVDFTVSILRSERLGFDKFLHSQRESIYWILDDALCRICLDQWDVDERKHLWNKAVEPIQDALLHAQEKMPDWNDLDFHGMLRFQDVAERSKVLFNINYFKRTQTGRISEILRTARLSGIGRLPLELADVIVEDVLRFERLHTGDLRSSYLSKGKGSAWSAGRKY
jgi:hypothetical protein